MHAIPMRTCRMLLAATVLGSSFAAFAGQEMMMLEAPQRAKVAKEKIRAGARQRKLDEQEKKSADESATCGSQSIGNIDTGGFAGPAPREVFVFAPNAVNVVGRGGCR